MKPLKNNFLKRTIAMIRNVQIGIFLDKNVAQESILPIPEVRMVTFYFV